MREMFLQFNRRSGGGDVNPFEAEDRKEAFENRQQYRRAMQHPVDASVLNAAAAAGMGITAQGTAAGQTGTGFGASTGGGFGAGTGTGFGAAKTGFGAGTGTGFGAAKTGFGVGTGFGAAKTGFGAGTGTGFGAAKTGFGASAGTGTGFGASPAKTGFGAGTGTGFGSSPAKTGQGLNMGGGISLNTGGDNLGMPLDKPTLSRDNGGLGVKKKGFGSR
jgi:hypothetical protein